MRKDELMTGMPAEVVRAQGVLAVQSRLVIVRLLLDEPRTFAALNEQLDLSATALRNSLEDLTTLGYVSDDSPEGRLRKSKVAVFTVNRDMVLRDLSELFLYLAR